MHTVHTDQRQETNAPQLRPLNSGSFHDYSKLVSISPLRLATQRDEEGAEYISG